MGVIHTAGAERVEDHVHHDAAARRLLERVGKLVGHATLVIHVRFQADAFSRFFDGLEHGGKNLVTVDEHVVGIAVNKVGRDQRCQILGSGRIFGRHGAPELDRLLVLGEGQHGGRDDDRHQGNLEEEDHPWMSRASNSHGIQHCNFVAASGPGFAEW
jgi:hypothetical protein